MLARTLLYAVTVVLASCDTVTVTESIALLQTTGRGLLGILGFKFQAPIALSLARYSRELH